MLLLGVSWLGAKIVQERLHVVIICSVCIAMFTFVKLIALWRINRQCLYIVLSCACPRFWPFHTPLNDHIIERQRTYQHTVSALHSHRHKQLHQ